MRKLDALIAELCPNGVEYKKLSDIAIIDRGVRVVKKNLSQENGFPVYQNSLVPLGYHTESNREGNTPFVISAGAAGDVGYSEEKFWAADDCLTVVSGNTVTNRYIYHVLMNSQPILYSKVRKASIPRLSRTVIEGLQIPVPPIEVQREIVRILDNFTELTAELTAELASRKKQYDYYRDSILQFSNDVPRVPLSDVIHSLNTGLNPRKFFRLNTDDATNYYITIREIRGGKIMPTEKTDMINDDALRLCNNRSNLEVGDVLFSGTGTIGETVVIEEPPVNWNIKEGVYTIKPKKDRLVSRYLRYILMTTEMRSTYMKKVAGGTVKSIPMAEMKKLIIPLPTIQEQQKLVDILDRFDSLCNGISEGLPAEIDARQKQYEYYRDKLLSFKEA